MGLNMVCFGTRHVLLQMVDFFLASLQSCYVVLLDPCVVENCAAM